jgi:hypothetical protein
MRSSCWLADESDGRTELELGRSFRYFRWDFDSGI